MTFKKWLDGFMHMLPSRGVYVVKSGDTLSDISKRMYGDGNMYPKIFDANRDQLSDPDKIKPGQRLRIPRR